MASFFTATFDMSLFILSDIENTLCFCYLKYLGCCTARTFSSWFGYVGDTTSSILICPFHPGRWGGGWAHCMLELWSKKFFRNHIAQPYRSDLSEFTQIISGIPQTKIQRFERQVMYFIVSEPGWYYCFVCVACLCWDLETKLASTCPCILPWSHLLIIGYWSDIANTQYVSYRTALLVPCGRPYFDW